MIVETLSALAEPTRLQAVWLLHDGSEHCVCALMEKLGATQSRMSRHMQVLRNAGLVVDRRDGPWVHYRLNDTLPPELKAIVDAVCAARAIPERTVA